MTDLIERLSALDGPDREVDTEIALLGGWCLHPTDRQRDDSAQSDRGYTCLDCGADSWGNTGPTGQRRGALLPHFTSSIDAALTLVPQGWFWKYDSTRGKATLMGYTTGVTGHQIYNTIEGFGAAINTPAIAICIAACKAIEAQDKRGK